MDDKSKLKKICLSYDYNKYKNIDLNSLAAFTIKHLQDNKVFLNFENIAVALYLMFPTKFCMIGYEEYPDTNRINRTVNLQLRPKYQNIAFGDSKKGYYLTNKGKALSEQVEKILHGAGLNLKIKKSEINDTNSKRTINIHEEIENKIKSKYLFNKYLTNNTSEVTKLEIYEFLSASPYTSKNVLKDYFNKLKDLAKQANDKEVLDFLDWFYKKANNV